MKKSLPIVLAFALFAFIGSSALAQTFDYPVKGKQGFNLTEKTRDGLHITYNVGQVTLNQLNYRGEDMCEVSISSVSLPNDEGMPNLRDPSLRRRGRMLRVPAPLRRRFDEAAGRVPRQQARDRGRSRAQHDGAGRE